MKGALSIVAATGLFALGHSLLASRQAKQVAGKLVGETRRDRGYRAFFVAQSVVSSAALAAYIKSRPTRELYRLERPSRVVLRAGQVAALSVAADAVGRVGFRRMSGLAGLDQPDHAGRTPFPRVEAQGPAPNANGRLDTSGPFGVSRHPLNFWPLVALWLNPTMTTRLLNFNIAATFYLVVGSLHEERRLLAAYGEQYEAYRRSGVPFFIPWPRRLHFSPRGNEQQREPSPLGDSGAALAQRDASRRELRHGRS